MAEQQTMSESDFNYYRNRAAAERKAAARAANETIAELHLELARLYDAKGTCTAGEINVIKRELEEIERRLNGCWTLSLP